MGFRLLKSIICLGLCYVKLDIPKYAEQYFREALLLRPGYDEALQELARLGVA